MKIIWKHILLVLVAAWLLVGCQAAMYGTGTDLNKINIGMTKDQVLTVLGKPVNIGADAISDTEKYFYRKMGHVTDMFPTSYEVVFKNGKVIKFGEATSAIINVGSANTEVKTDVVDNSNETLHPKKIQSKLNSDAVAVIIGIQNYKRLSKADFASQDAHKFYEYAHHALGIPKDRIKILTDADADQAAFLKTFRNWLPLHVNKDKTDVLVFYSGHGLPSSDGKSLYLLPYGVDHDLLDETAVDQRKMVAAIQAAKPKSVTMFIDSCYSGLSKNGETLLAGAKPVSLKSSDIGYPAEFTVMTASSPDQISSSSPELQHGIFSFYLMKGMEGDADTDKDGKITVGEMQKYLVDNVQRHAMSLNRKQMPQLIGDASRVLVTK
jgi:outer membrane protein assembly factor BamE (lipoprotein component of BamABCDE complex)